MRDDVLDVCRDPLGNVEYVRKVGNFVQLFLLNRRHNTDHRDMDTGSVHFFGVTVRILSVLSIETTDQNDDALWEAVTFQIVVQNLE